MHTTTFQKAFRNSILNSKFQPQSQSDALNKSIEELDNNSPGSLKNSLMSSEQNNSCEKIVNIEDLNTLNESNYTIKMKSMRLIIKKISQLALTQLNHHLIRTLL